MEAKRKLEPADGPESPKRAKLDSLSAVFPLTDPGCSDLPPEPFAKTEKQRCTSEDRNIFSELEKMQPSTAAITEVCYMPQAIPSLGHDTSTYVENNTQPSPKDSGIDVSSPDRKFEDLGDLSSQESSPRVTDASLRLDTAKDICKGKPKYAAIGNIAEDQSSDLYLTNSVKSYAREESFDSNMNNSKSVSSNSHCVTETANDGSHLSVSLPESNLLQKTGSDQEDMCFTTNVSDPAMVIPAESDIQQVSLEHSHAQCSEADMFGNLSEETATSRHISGPDLDDGDRMDNPSEILCTNDCTLAELNMSQKSTEVDLPSLLDRDMESQNSELGDDNSSIGVFDVGDGLDDNIFSPLNDDSTCSFSVSGTPNKRLCLTPRGTPSQQPLSKPAVTCSAASTSRSGLPGTPSLKPTGFLSEFAKFLQQSRDDGPDSDTDEVPLLQYQQSLSKEPTCVKKSVHKSQTVNLVKPTNSVSGDEQQRASRRESKRTESLSAGCFCCSTGQKSLTKSRFNASRFIKSQKKVHSLRLKVNKLLHALFPDLDYPCRNNRTLNTVDFLLDQITCVVQDRKRPCGKAEVIPSSAGTMDVRIILCKAPLGCLRQLRRKVCHFLETVLPDLNLGYPFDRSGADVEDLVQEVTRWNTS